MKEKWQGKQGKRKIRKVPKPTFRFLEEEKHFEELVNIIKGIIKNSGIKPKKNKN